MLNVKPIAMAAAKWVRNAQAGAQSYVEGVQTTAADQAAAAIAAEPQYEQGVQAGIARKAFSAGLRKSGKDKWLRGSLEKGSARFPQGVATAQPSYEANTSRSFDVLRSLTLPPRGPKGSPQNYSRVPAVGNALRQAATGGK